MIWYNIVAKHIVDTSLLVSFHTKTLLVKLVQEKIKFFRSAAIVNRFPVA